MVDDDELVGKAIGRTLGDFDVTYAQSANGALGRLQAGGRFAAIVCDRRMPGMDGVQFHGAVERVDPALAHRIVFVTGWAHAPEFEAFLRRTGCACLEKPFQAVELRRAVIALVGGEVL